MDSAPHGSIWPVRNTQPRALSALGRRPQHRGSQPHTNRYGFWRINWVPETELGLVWAARAIETTATPLGDYHVDGTLSIVKHLSTVSHGFNADPSPLLNDTMRAVCAPLPPLEGPPPLRCVVRDESGAVRARGR